MNKYDSSEIKTSLIEWIYGADETESDQQLLKDTVSLIEELESQLADLSIIAREQENAHIAANLRNADLLRMVEELQAQVERIARNAKSVMDLLEEHGADILPHLLDTDENAGQRLRDDIAEAQEGE